MTTKNVVEKFKSLYRSLSPTEREDLYLLLAMMRGPDITDSYNEAGPSLAQLKTEITCRIRCLLGIIAERTRTANSKFTPYIEYSPFSSKEYVFKMLREARLAGLNEHYLDHANDALVVLSRLGYIKDTDQKGDA